MEMQYVKGVSLYNMGAKIYSTEYLKPDFTKKWLL